jgi:uncharacterized repeat protein (TIGR01451 family)
MSTVWSQRFAAQVAAVAFIFGAGVAQATPVQRFQVNQSGDLKLIGNTLGQDCRAGDVPLPLAGFVDYTRCGGATDDLAPDVFWRSDADGGFAVADLTIGPDQARSTGMLQLPAGATVTYARLFWGALRATGLSSTPANLDAGTVADPDVIIERPGTFSRVLTADSTNVARTNSASFPSSVDRFFYQSSVDVTALVQQYGPGAFRVSNVASVDFRNVFEHTQVAGWSMVIVYALASDPVRNITIYDGLEPVQATATGDARITLSGFQVPTLGFDAKLAVFAYEGDNSITGDSLSFDGITVYPDGGKLIGDGGPLSDAVNPADNFFNESRSTLGVATHVAGDQPELAGSAGSMNGIDLDVVDVTNRVKAGQSQALVVANTSRDVYLIGMLATSIATFTPVLKDSVKSVRDVTPHPGGAVRPGDTLEYTLTITNTGNDDAVNVVVTDTLPSGLTYVPGSVSVSGGTGFGSYANGVVTARIGAGATASAGGQLAVGATVTVTFRATIDALAIGSVPNQGLITGAGLRGTPPFQVGTGNATTPFTPTTVTVTLTPPPTLDAPATGSTVSTSTPTFSGTGEPGATVTVKVDGATVCTATVNGSGSWSCTASSAIPDGPHTATATEASSGSPASTAATSGFTIDSTPPNTTINSGPAQVTGNRNASFAVSGTDSGSGVAGFECSLDGSAFTPCPMTNGVVTYANVPDGSHTLLVRAVDNAGNKDPSPASYTWTVDPNAATGPTITSPANGSNLNQPPTTITGTGTPGETVTVTLDGQTVCTGVVVTAAGTWSCSLTATPSDGPHTINATEFDSNHVASPVATSSFIVDTAAPDTTIVTKPPATTASHAASFSFSSNEQNVTYECNLDHTSFGACPQTLTYPNMTDGTHHIDVRAVDRAGNKDPSPATWDWTVAQPNQVVITAPANGSSTNDTTPEVTGTGEPGSTVSVAVDGQVICDTAQVDAQGHWTCQTTAALGQGSHTATATPASGTAASSTFTVDTTAPDTTIVDGPTGAGTSSASFTYGSNETPVTYECSLDHGAWQPCTTPDVISGLSDGDHHLDVRATDAAGNTDSTPAGWDWTVGAGGSSGSSGSSGTTATSSTLGGTSGGTGTSSGEPLNLAGGGLFNCGSAGGGLMPWLGLLWLGSRKRRS